MWSTDQVSIIPQASLFSQEKLTSHMKRRHPKNKRSKYNSLPFVRDDSDEFEPDNFALDIEMDDEFVEFPTEHLEVGEWETDWFNGSGEFEKQLRSFPSKACVESTLIHCEASGGDKQDKELPDRVIMQTGIDAAPAMVDWDFSGELCGGGGWVFTVSRTRRRGRPRV